MIKFGRRKATCPTALDIVLNAVFGIGRAMESTTAFLLESPLRGPSVPDELPRCRDNSRGHLLREPLACRKRASRRMCGKRSEFELWSVCGLQEFIGRFLAKNLEPFASKLATVLCLIPTEIAVSMAS